MTRLMTRPRAAGRNMQVIDYAPRHHVPCLLIGRSCVHGPRAGHHPALGVLS